MTSLLLTFSAGSASFSKSSDGSLYSISFLSSLSSNSSNSLSADPPSGISCARPSSSGVSYSSSFFSSTSFSIFSACSSGVILSGTGSSLYSSIRISESYTSGSTYSSASSRRESVSGSSSFLLKRALRFLSVRFSTGFSSAGDSIIGSDFCFGFLAFGSFSFFGRFLNHSANLSNRLTMPAPIAVNPRITKLKSLRSDSSMLL